MGCSSCSTGKDGKPGGCQSNGGCTNGGCNRLNTFDWLAKLDIYEPNQYDVVEVSFKSGSRKAFFKNQIQNQTTTGDLVVVETEAGYDIGHIALSGDLVRLQMKKKRVNENSVLKNIIRRANERDLDRLNEARQREQKTMVRARAIARTLDLDMKIGDVEFQADNRKATFFYTAEGRVDFRELIRHFAKEFRVKIEMRQIGARQESARIGGIGSCGRELCCSTWLSDFKTVSTTAARYQNLAINQAKLSGQCGRLKCCLNYELDTYMDALESFPVKAEKLKTEVGNAVLIKTDIFKGIMFYAYQTEHGRGKFYALKIDRVKEIQAMNAKGEVPTDLMDIAALLAEQALEEHIDYDAVNDVIELPPEERKRRRNKKRKKPRNGAKKDGKNPNNRSKNKSQGNKNRKPKTGESDKSNKSKPNNKRRNNGPKTKDVNKNNTQQSSKPKSTTGPKKENSNTQQGPNTNGAPKKKKKNRFWNRNKKKNTPPKKD